VLERCLCSVVTLSYVFARFCLFSRTSRLKLLHTEVKVRRLQSRFSSFGRKSSSLYSLCKTSFLTRLPQMLLFLLASLFLAVDGKVYTVLADRGFKPNVTTVSLGDTVLFTWTSDAHNVVQGSWTCAAPANCKCSSSSPVPATLDSGSLKDTGYSWSIAIIPANGFASGETYNFLCQQHCQFGMTGAIIVK
jgi:plastocyanin